MASRITTEAELRALYDEPIQRALDKVVPQLTDAHRRFVERSPFLVIGSHGPSGADVSPRGDQPGWVKIVDARTLAIPDRVGNGRIDTLTNVLTNPAVALIFFVPGVNETLRVSGNAHISTEPELLTELAHDGRLPTSVLVVEVTEAFHQCVRALRRAELWNPGVFAGEDFPRISSTPESTYDGKLY
jgi:PPOX class probable FMN-dependent enzyme